MFKKATTIIVGAGASVEFGFPTGDELKTRIAALVELDDDHPFGFADMRIQSVMQAEQSACQPQQFRLFGERMRGAAASIIRALPSCPSIDNLIHSLQDEYVTKLAKLAIAIIILESEKGSKFWKSSSPGYDLSRPDRGRHRRIDIRNDDIKNSWYYSLANLLFTDVKKDEIAKAFMNVTFVIFNYDRCLETFLFEVIQDRFDVDAVAAEAVLRNVQFLHPYGLLGPLAWQTYSDRGHLPFGHMDGVPFWDVAKSLQTFTEVVDSVLGQAIKASMGEAYAHLYVGFGFLGQNVELLRPAGNRRAGLAVATAHGFSESDRLVVAQILDSLGREFGVSTGVEPSKCRQMFDDRRLELSTI